MEESLAEVLELKSPMSHDSIGGPSSPTLCAGQLRAAQRLLSIKSRLQHKKLNYDVGYVNGEASNGGHQRHTIMNGEGSSNYKQDNLDDYLQISGSIISLIPTKKQVFQLLESLYRDHPGAVWRAASRGALDEQKGKENLKNLVYGEISFIALESLLSAYVPLAGQQIQCRRVELGDAGTCKAGINFYDLGCGAGRVVFTASLLHTHIAKSCGVEIVPSMHGMNQDLSRLYNTEVWPYLHKLKQAQQVQFVCGDFLEVDWSDANLVFTNATCFDDGLFEKLESRASTILKEGSIVITVTRFFLDHTTWELLEQRERRMSWSSAMVYVYKKRALSHTLSLQSPSSSIN